MKKKIVSSMLVLILLATVAYGVNESIKEGTSLSDLAWANVEALASSETSLCYSGGMGSTSCSIDGGVEILGVGISGGCSVSCVDGYYACCSLRCTCIKNS